MDHPAHAYAKYTKDEGVWHNGSSNMSEVAYNIVSAGRGLTFSFREEMPGSHAVYMGKQEMYERARGRGAHTSHSLISEEYTMFLDELWATMNKYPCDREWML